MTAKVSDAAAPPGSGLVRNRLSYRPAFTSDFFAGDQSHRTPSAHSSTLTMTRYEYSVSGWRPVTQQWFVPSVRETATPAPDPSNTSTRAGPYGADRAPIVSRRGG